MDTVNVALQRITLRDLNPYVNNALIIAVIIGKQQPRKFVDVKSGTDASRAVWNFTLRESRQDYINVTCWGTSDWIYQLHDKFHYGDVVEVINPTVTIRQLDDYGERFKPMVTSPYSLTLGHTSDLVKHQGNSLAFYQTLLRYPTKPVAGFVPLRDVLNNGASMKDTTIDILVATKRVGDIRNITTRDGGEAQVREVEVFDHTCPSFKITLWNEEIIARCNTWKPRFTTVFITDIKVNWSSFYKCFIGQVTSRSIVTENPICQEVKSLIEYAKSAPINTNDIVDQFITKNFPHPDTIQNVMSIKQVQDKINTILRGEHSDKQFTALLYAFVSNLDLDGIFKVVFFKCGRCKTPMKNSQNCENPDCSHVISHEVDGPQAAFNIRVMLSDHTGSLVNCRLRGLAAELALGCTAQEFTQMSEDEKAILKWRFLLERCTIPVAVMIFNNQTPNVSILNISVSNKFEVAQRLPVC